MENQTEDQKTKEFIQAQKEQIIQTLKLQNLDKEGAKKFLTFAKDMLIQNSEFGITAEMTESLKTEWSTIEEEILKDYN